MGGGGRVLCAGLFALALNACGSEDSDELGKSASRPKPTLDASRATTESRTDGGTSTSPALDPSGMAERDPATTTDDEPVLGTDAEAVETSETTPKPDITTDAVATLNPEPSVSAAPEPVAVGGAGNQPVEPAPSVDVECGLQPPAAVAIAAVVACDECPAELDVCNAVTGVPSLDRYFLAEQSLADAAVALETSLRYWVAQAHLALSGEPPTSDEHGGATALASLLQSGVNGALAGLRVEFFAFGCSVASSDYLALAAACDADLDPAATHVRCDSICEGNATQTDFCAGQLICRDPIEQCQGSCMGICETVDTCRGVCVGDCEVTGQVCPGQCLGALDDAGNCTGVCEVYGTSCPGSCTLGCEMPLGDCNGTCRGECWYTPATGACEEISRCVSETAGDIDCAGRCHGRASVQLSAPCEASTAVLAGVGQDCVVPTTQAFYELADETIDRGMFALQANCAAVSLGELMALSTHAQSLHRSAQELVRDVVAIDAAVDAFAETDAAAAECARSMLELASARSAISSLRLLDVANAASEVFAVLD